MYVRGVRYMCMVHGVPERNVYVRISTCVLDMHVYFRETHMSN